MVIKKWGNFYSVWYYRGARNKYNLNVDITKNYCFTNLWCCTVCNTDTVWKNTPSLRIYINTSLSEKMPLEYKAVIWSGPCDASNEITIFLSLSCTVLDGSSLCIPFHFHFMPCQRMDGSKGTKIDIQKNSLILNTDHKCSNDIFRFISSSRSFSRRQFWNEIITTGEFRKHTFLFFRVDFLTPKKMAWEIEVVMNHA